jgi:hypothetical protein
MHQSGAGAECATTRWEDDATFRCFVFFIIIVGALGIIAAWLAIKVWLR